MHVQRVLQLQRKICKANIYMLYAETERETGIFRRPKSLRRLFLSMLDVAK